MTVPDNILFEMKGGNHPDQAMNAIETSIAETAWSRICNEPIFAELSPKTVYNYTYLNTIYGTQNPFILQTLQRLEPYPQMIEMEVVQGICPLRCIQCELTYWKEKPLQASFEQFKYVMDQFPVLRWAGNNGLGDPFTNPEYHKMVKYLDDKQVPQEIYLTSYLLEQADMERFVDYKSFLFTKFSFDGATKETYEKCRVGSDFDKVVKNIKALHNFKRAKGRHWPKIEFHYLLMKQNIHEAEMFIDFVNGLDIECSGIMYSRLLHTYPEIKDVYTDVPADLGSKLVEKGKQVGIPVYFNGDTLEKKPPAYNCSQWTMPYIFPDGTVIPCCNPNEANMRSWQRENSMGNVFETPFRDIWDGSKYKALRQSLKLGNPADYSSVCKKLCVVHDIGCKKC